MAMPKVPINFVSATSGEMFSLGQITIRVMEDGSHTDNRIGSAEFTLPPQIGGPPAHWHEMHDETFMVTKGSVRFHAPEGKTIDAKVGDFVTVPTRAPHTFSNPFDEEAKFLCTFTPAFYINYFRILGEMVEKGVAMDKEINLEVMARYATLPAEGM
ncbi:hypothetical protein W97_02301 [Coniosporium apollinis CBS 100218]|uniref:Cupin type-2 domain-containing protein n=1 Tax=Coniosporium apollinis (strain CBS 100218) TaxID=1168221 RepID=R7YMN7_CONA1|nr:uncharacterized protein W97_02301 [Coniosporium apollinis CBS 100218]EON63074.1 hypothetical protein W97_02301 [Coniosporium apollinis CBS 100218]